MKRFWYSFIGLLMSTMAQAEDPISWKIISETLPVQSSIYSIYHITYKITSHLPFVMPEPLIIETQLSTDEFVVDDGCSHVTLKPNESCYVLVELNPDVVGEKEAGLTIHYAANPTPLPKLKTSTVQSWAGVIGVDYSPNHYPSNYPQNGHDVFYAGSLNGQAASNMYMELAQLQAAGFNTVRSYETVEYSWIDMIRQANALNMNIVYEAVIPQSGGQSDIDMAVSVLNNVITAVTASVFQNTVSLVFAGHENYSGSNAVYLTDAVVALQQALSQNSLSSIPVGSAFNAGDLIAPPSGDIQTIVSSYSAGAPYAFDPYPFQIGVPVANAVTSSPTPVSNSIAWDYEQVMMQSYYTSSPRPILMAETGWASEGTNTGYECSPNCDATLSSEAIYLPDIYAYVRNMANNSSAFVFYAYDAPAKSSIPTDAENFYGMFNYKCDLKSNNSSLLPNTAYSPSANYGCQGLAEGALFVVVGSSITGQPPFTVQITQTNPNTPNGSMTVSVPTEDRTNTNVHPWPNFLVFNNASIQITGSNPENICTGTAAVAGTPPVLTLPNTLSCQGQYPTIGCSGTNCFLPNPF